MNELPSSGALRRQGAAGSLDLLPRQDHRRRSTSPASGSWCASISTCRSKDGVVADATRIARVLPTIAQTCGRRRQGRGAVASRPSQGRGDARHHAAAGRRQDAGADAGHQGHLHRGDCVGDEVKRGLEALKPGDVAVLENLRYHKGEEKNDPDFAKALAALGDIYVNDAFSSAHRAHASIEAIADLLPSYAGLLMMAEITALGQALEHAEAAGHGHCRRRQGLDQDRGPDQSRPRAWTSSWLAAAWPIPSFSPKASRSARRYASPMLCRLPRRSWRWPSEPAARSCCRIDVVVAKELKDGCRVAGLPGRRRARRRHDPRCRAAKPRRSQAAPGRASSTVLWNGPLGAFETPPFGEGTFALAREVAGLTRAGKLVSVAGGGDTVRHSTSRASPAISPMSRPPAGRSWNGWAATTCRRLWPWPEAVPAPRLRSIHAFSHPERRGCPA